MALGHRINGLHERCEVIWRSLRSDVCPDYGSSRCEILQMTLKRGRGVSCRSDVDFARVYRVRRGVMRYMKEGVVLKPNNLRIWESQGSQHVAT